MPETKLNITTRNNNLSFNNNLDRFICNFLIYKVFLYFVASCTKLIIQF